MGRTPLRFEALTGLEPAWRKPMSWLEIAILVLVVFAFIYIIRELKQ
jgi:hypothetical protein